ncbi:MAG TPA: hypothetical protein VME40_04090 [Caulobacteraceae bacterium]|nr:hypothetical protein [Caulobacteraceae bacterium]
MSDAFEFRLERMFAESPAMPDVDLFTLETMGRLDRGWTARRLVIGGMGAIGGLIGATQIVGSGALGQLHALGAQGNAYLAERLAQVVPAGLSHGGIGLDVETLWMIGALAVAAAGFGLVRLVREI